MSALLSIQSAVTIGAVGNTMAELVMAPSRHHLSRVDTVQLTAHPGHGFRAGGSIPDNDFADLLNGLTQLDIWGDFAAVMVGYIGTAGQIPPINAVLARYRQDGQGPVLLDPAIGDHGRIYVDRAIAQGVREDLLPEASILTPNAFELGFLTSSLITDPDSARSAASKMLATYPNLEGIAVTGISVPDGVADAWIDRAGMTLFEKPALARNSGGFSGAGDLFAALLMVHWLNGRNWIDAAAAASRLSGDVLQRSDEKNLSNISLDAVREISRRIKDHV